MDWCSGYIGRCLEEALWTRPKTPTARRSCHNHGKEEKRQKTEPRLFWFCIKTSLPFLALVVLHGIMRCDAVQGFGQPVQPAMDMRKYLDVPFRCDHVHQASPTVELFAHSCRVVFTFTPSDGKVVGVCWCTYSLRQCLCSLASSYTILRFKLGKLHSNKGLSSSLRAA